MVSNASELHYVAGAGAGGFSTCYLTLHSTEMTFTYKFMWKNSLI